MTRTTIPSAPVLLPLPQWFARIVGPHKLSGYQGIHPSVHRIISLHWASEPVMSLGATNPIAVERPRLRDNVGRLGFIATSHVTSICFSIGIRIAVLGLSSLEMTSALKGGEVN